MAEYTDRGLGLSSMDIGTDTSGLEVYKGKLKTELLTTVQEKIDDISSVTAALDKGWQGVSRDRFDQNFAAVREQLKLDLQAEYENLSNRLDELAYFYIQQDRNMILEDK